jgi:hypothetical protein
MKDLMFVSGTSACALLLLPGCGGGGTTYSGTAFAACLSREGASTFGTSSATAEQRAVLGRVLGSAYFVGARFAAGAEDGFAFASDASTATKIEGRIESLARSPLATASLVKTDGNLVLLMPVHSTAGVRRIISSCKANARLS